MYKFFYFLLLTTLFSCGSNEKQNTNNDLLDSKPQATWYKGNTHCHTTLCGHADTTPENVTKWYHDRGYNFLILSEHNIYIDPATVKMPIGKRDDFILVPGEEVTGSSDVHTTGMNTQRYTPAKWDEIFKDEDLKIKRTKVEQIQFHVDSIGAAGGVPILNHPNFKSGVSAAELQQVNGMKMFELYNGHPQVYNFGNEKHASVEQKWDSLLTSGYKILGVSSDDAHSFQNWAIDKSNPGRGWVMVNSKALTPDEITASMERGDFYATNGVTLNTVDREGEVYKVSINKELTEKEVASPYVIGKKIESGNEGFLIEFITQNGEVINSTEGLEDSMSISKAKNYLRCRITYTRKIESGYEQFFAWTQPRFI